MKVITPGHRYELEQSQTTGKPTSAPQVLQFIEKRVDALDPKSLVLVNEGTTNEELIKVLIDRIEFLNTKMPHRQNEIAIEALENALGALEARTAERKQANIEGTAIAGDPANSGTGATPVPAHPETVINGTDDAGRL